MNERVVITVDGLAGSGKTTLSKMLAEKLNFCHLNSGSLYRAVGYLALQKDISADDPAKLKEMLERHSVSLDLDEKGVPVLSIDGVAYGEVLHTPAVSESTSRCAANSVVRDFLRQAQREAFAGKPLVAEGRDMGTVIFPDAALKFFVEVDATERVNRRMKQLAETRPEMSLKERNDLAKQMEVEIIERDARDIGREIAPTVPAADAVIINNSSQTLTQVVQSMYASVANKGLV